MHVIDEIAPLAAESGERANVHPVPARRKRGRPLEMQPDEVLGRIRKLADQDALFRVHLDQPGFYARARRLYGSWAGALAAAQVDHAAALAAARRRAHESRRRTRRSSIR